MCPKAVGRKGGGGLSKSWGSIEITIVPKNCGKGLWGALSES